jgi:arylformamidase
MAQDGAMLIDLSHVITEGMVTYPGLAGPELSDVVTREQSAERFNGIRMHIGKVCMVTNTGTYIDVPFHFHEDKEDLSEVGVDRVADLPGIVVPALQRSGRAVTPSFFAGLDLRGKAVLVHTGWDVHFGTERYGIDGPFLPLETVEFLLAEGAALVGIDSVNIDDMGDITRPAHFNLLAAGVPIVEHLTNLAALPLPGAAEFRFTAAPPKFTALGTFPVRAFAQV